MRNSATVKKEVIVIDLDNEDEDEDVLRGDHQYMKLLDSIREDGTSYLMSVRYEVDNGEYDTREINQSRGGGRNRRDGHCRRTKIPVNVESKLHHVEASTKKTRKRQRESLVTDTSVEEMLTTTSREKKDSEGEIVISEHYRSYLKWLVENNSKNPTTSSDPIIQVKREEDTMSFSDSDSDIIAVEDRPFLDEEDSPFVPSKSYHVVDLEDKSGEHQRSSGFKKEIMNLLKQPYNENEFLELKHQVSVRRSFIQCRELRNGKEVTYENKKKKGRSYLRRFPDFKKKLRESLREKDRRRALNLLRGFFFYLQKVSRDDAFKPWLDRDCLKITCF